MSKSEYRTKLIYQGPVKAVIFDWAGTVVDCGVFSPTGTFLKIFEDEGVTITEGEARGPMGIHKRTHIEKIVELESVKERWMKSHKGKEPTGDDVDRMYTRFTPIQKIAVKKYAKPIQGVVEAVNWLRKRNIKIGSCTGFAKEIVDVLKEEAALHGYKPDCYVAADEVPEARPLPHMVWLNAIRMNVAPIEAIIKVDDTVDGIREGISAGCWTVAVAKTSNYVACTEEQLEKLSEEELARKLKRSYEILGNSGAHYVIDSVADLPEIVENINLKLSLGQKP